MRAVRRAAVGYALMIAATLAVPAMAAAGTYTDWECGAPGGAPLAAQGFEGQQTAKASAVNTCGAAGGSLSVGLTDQSPWQGGLSASFTYAAPANTRISGVTLDRSTTGAPTAASLLTYRISADTSFLTGCLPSAVCGGDVAGTFSRTDLAAGSLLFTAGCSGLSTDVCVGATPLRLVVTRAAIALRDDIAPTVGNVKGTLFAPAAKAGTATVEFDAADLGGGVYRMVTTIDGATFEVQPAALGTCTDVDPTNSNPYEFPAKVPCPLTQAGLSVAIDTTKLAEGAHTIGVALEDAAGNAVNVVGPASRFTVRNARPNGSPAGRTVNGRLRMWFASNRGRRHTIRAGRRVVVRGVLRDRRGRGIRGAQVELYHYVRGRPRLLKTGLRSRGAGRLTIILPKNLFGDARGRRRLAFYYRASLPGRVTSRANLFLTILNRRGQPQTNSRR
jgi:hypothetical protein